MNPVRWLFTTLLMASVVVAAGQGADLPGLTVTVDEQPVDIGLVRGESTAFRLPLRNAVRALAGERANVTVKDNVVCSITVDGVERVRMGLKLGAEPVAKVLDASGKIVRSIDLNELPIRSGERLEMEVESLCRILGDSANLDGETLSLNTPEYWARQVALPDEVCRGLNARSVGAGVLFGITPPARRMVAWVRSVNPAYAQIYKLTGGPARPLLAMGLDGKRRNTPGPNDLVTSIACGASAPARAITEHIGAVDGKVAEYVGIVVEKRSGGDPIEAIRNGTAGAWTVVGMRQRVTPSPLDFSEVPVPAGKTLADVAKGAKMPMDLLLALNGLGQSSKLGPGESLLVIAPNLKPLPKGGRLADPGDLYEVKSGDTLASLSSTWGQSVEAVLDLNPDLLPGQALVPGQIVLAPAGVRAAKKIVEIDEFGKTKAPTFMHKTSDLDSAGVPIAAKKKVLVMNRVEGDLFQIQCDGEVGYVPVVSIALTTEAAEPAVVSLPRRPANAELAIRQEALQHLGTRYLWGGGSLTNGIDCSHYVSAVMTRVGLRSPSPPVINQEQSGVIVHWKQGPARYGRRSAFFEDPTPPLSVLRPGDRIIIQWDPINDREGGRHTGIYIGQYGRIKHGVVNATKSRGVAVTELLTNYFWKGYRFAVRDVPKNSAGRRKT